MVIVILIISLCYLLLKSVSSIVSEVGPPNIIFILVSFSFLHLYYYTVFVSQMDDIGAGDVGYSVVLNGGIEDIPTPNLDFFADAGIKLVHSYTFPINSDYILDHRVITTSIHYAHQHEQLS